MARHSLNVRINEKGNLGMKTIIIGILAIGAIFGIITLIFSRRADPKERVKEAAGAAAGGAMMTAGCFIRMIMSAISILIGVFLIGLVLRSCSDTSFHDSESNEQFIKECYPTLSDDAYNMIISHFDGEITSWPACNEYISSATQNGLSQEDRDELASLTKKGISLLPPRERSFLEAKIISETKGSRRERERLLQKAINSLSEDDLGRWLEINTKALERGLLKKIRTSQVR